ncbi:acyl-CoA/acyl-ACP dehydrogenase [Leptolyngbya sp. 15MV]|nr:acyl-CoA/acyl-ACP dehydrogenase [Leptolyngbya sp. 15MV]
MEFRFTDEQAMIAETAQAFFAKHATSARTRAAMAGEGIDRELWRALAQELGLTGVAMPEAHGGAGLGMVEFAILAEAAGAHVGALPLLGLATVGRGIAAGGSDEQRTAWLPRLASGEVIAAFADAPLVPHGAVVDLFLTREGALVEAGGARVEPLTTMDETRPLARVDVAGGTPLANAAAGLEAAYQGGWLCLAAEALGGAQACLDRTVAYSRERVQFGRAIGSFQAYKHRLADMMVGIEQARSAVYWAACTIDEASPEAPLALHAAKSFAADTFFRCAGDMIQLHGGIGFTWEHDAHLFFKRARSIQTLLGSGEWHREQVAATVLGEAA